MESITYKQTYLDMVASLTDHKNYRRERSTTVQCQTRVNQPSPSEYAEYTKLVSK
jgi:uncharacterized 2Fe-2S/4Fe-4S cluster protein (DUF4445 family)